jgi:acetyltransferase-like isoleucine patch superfamily enzyme
VARSAKLFGKKYIKLGFNVEIGDFAVLKTFGGIIEIGLDSQIGPCTVLYGGKSGIIIGKYVMVGPHVMFAVGSHNYKQTDVPMLCAEELNSKGPIIVEDDVWIGAHCVICDGVHIATGCVIGAGAVVTKSTEAYGIYAGVPARKIGSRKS